MALALKDRVKETTIVVGTGTATLLGSSIGFQPFSVVGNGNTTYYCISDQFGSNWEVGIGTYTTSGNTLARTTVLASSNAGALVVFTAGVKDVFVTYPSEKGLWKDASGNAIGLGTPAAFVGTNITGTASGLTAGNVTTNANLTGAVTSTGNATSLGSFTSANLATALTDETGSGASVFATSPTLVTPALGTPTSGTLTNCTLPQLSASTGSSLVGTIQSGTGAVARTVASKLNDVISVKDFGAVGDGIADDTTAIQAVLAAFSATGGILSIPNGNYKISGTLNIPANVYVIGAGIDSTTITATHNGNIFYLNYNYCGILSLSITGPTNPAYTNSIAVSTNTNGTLGTGAITFTLSDLFITQCYTGIKINGSAHSTLERLIIQSNYGYGIYGAGSQGKWNSLSVNTNYLSGIYLIANTTGGIAGAAPFMSNIETFANGQYGIYVGTGAGLQLTNAFLNNDSQGEIYFDTSTIEDIGVISNSIIQYAGVNPFDPRNNPSDPYTGNPNAAGIWINTGAFSILNVSNVAFFGDAGCDIKSNAPVVCSGSTFLGCGAGIPAKGAFPAEPASATDVFAFKDTQYGYNKISGCFIGTPVEFVGDYNVISGCNFTGNSTTIPVFAFNTGSTNNIVSSSVIYQNNGAGVNFYSASGTTYSIGSDVNVYGGTTSASGSNTAAFTGAVNGTVGATTPTTGAFTTITGAVNGTVGATTPTTGAFTTITGSSDATINGATVGLGGGANLTNTALGSNALVLNSSGTNNVAIGYYALSKNTSGQGNLAISREALFTNVTGSFNTSIGFRSLYTSVGFRNTVVGYGAASAMTSATDNICIGYTSGNAITTGGGNVIIGSYTGAAAPISLTGTNYVVLSDGAGTIRTYYDASGNKVSYGVNATSAAAPTIASATTIAPTKAITFISGVTPIVTITAPSPISLGGGTITLIPTGIFTTTIAGNIALASTAVVDRALTMTYDVTAAKWYPSY